MFEYVKHTFSQRSLIPNIKKGNTEHKKTLPKKKIPGKKKLLG